jgi:hypothetical protein
VEEKGKSYVLLFPSHIIKITIKEKDMGWGYNAGVNACLVCARLWGPLPALPKEI